MFDRILSERNNQLLSNEEKNTPIDTNTAEFKELSFHFNTIFNDISQKSVSSDSKIYEIDRAYSLKNILVLSMPDIFFCSQMLSGIPHYL